MRKILILLALPLALDAQSDSSQGFDPNSFIQSSLPNWLRLKMSNAKFFQQYDFFLMLNPFYQRGDFDGDGEPDYAVQVKSKTTHERGIAIFRNSSETPVILGAGHDFGNGGPDWTWMWAWTVDSSPKTHRKGDALLVIKPGSASGWIFWDGTTFRWVQGAD